MSAVRSLARARNWCAPIMGPAFVVRVAECGPAAGCCGCVVGRVVEVESVGVGGRTRRPVLDFRPTVGVIVAACAGPATSVTPRWLVAARRVVSPRDFMGVHQPWVPVWLSAMRSEARARNWWVCPHSWCRCGCPQCGVQRGGHGGSLRRVYGKAPAVSVVLTAGALCVKLLGRR